MANGVRIRTLLKTSFLITSKNVSSLLYRGFVLTGRTATRMKIPIIVYHKITDVKDGIDSLWNVPPKRFTEHMEYLWENGFNVLSLHDFQMARINRKLPEKPIIITFDDGYANVYERAYPVLSMYGFPATLFLTVGNIDRIEPFTWDVPLIANDTRLKSEFRPLSWEEVREMNDGGLVSFGSHTMTHPHLGKVSRSKIDAELKGSKEMIEEKINRPVKFFSYPGGIKLYGDISEKTTEALMDAGYELACTSEIGRNSIHEDLYFLKRIGISRVDSINMFKAKLVGAYDWVKFAQSTFQHFFKNVY